MTSLSIGISIATAIALAQAPTANKPEFLVSCFDLGATDHPKVSAQQLAEQLQDEGWCTARAAPASSAWNRVPVGTDASKWVSVVTAGFHERSEAYAFMFDGTSGAVSLAAHVGHRKFLSRGAMQWASPFDKLLNGLRLAWHDRLGGSNLRLLSVKMTELAAAPADDKPGLDKKVQIDEALTVPPEKVLPPLEAILFAAAYEAGWAPTAAVADATALVEVRVRDQACFLRVTITQQGKKQVIVKDRVPWEEYHEQLLRIFQMPLLGEQVEDFARLSTGPLRILAATTERLYAIVDDELAAYDLASGSQAWRLKIPQSKVPTAPRKTEHYTARHDRGGRLHIYRYSKALSEIDLADGGEHPLAPARVAASWAFDVDGGTAATASGVTLALYRSGTPAWNHSESDPITCGPALGAGRVIAGNAKGELLALDAADGRQLWRTQLGGRLHGGLAEAGGSLVAFSAADETLYAVRLSDGTLKWKQAVGDALLEPPMALDSRLCVVTKSNRILSLDPSDGSIVRQTTWPTWLVSVAPLPIPGKLLACTDIDGRVTLLSQESLAPLDMVRLPTQLATGLALAPKMRTRWPSDQPARKDEILAAIDVAAAPTRPLLLVADQEGFLYLIAISRE